MRITVTCNESRRHMRGVGEDEGLVGDALDTFQYALSDVEITLEVDPKTGESEIVSVNGQSLAKKG